MGQADQGNNPIGPVSQVKSSGWEAGISPLPKEGSRRVRRSELPARRGADIALPDLSKVMEAFKSRANVGLTYIIDRETHSVIIKVIDRETNEVIREIPSEEMTKLRAVMRDLQGLLLKTQA